MARSSIGAAQVPGSRRRTEERPLPRPRLVRGPGVDEAERDRIFRPFQRGTTAHRRYRGAGLGLAIVRAVAEAHGGRVELSGEDGEGWT